MNNQNSSVEMPKVITVEIVEMGLTYRLYLRGVLLKKHFLTYEKAKAYISVLSEYFGDECSIYIKESPIFDYYGKVD